MNEEEERGDKIRGGLWGDKGKEEERERKGRIE